MNHPRASEVQVVASLAEPAGGVPGPVRDGRVDPASQDDRVGEVGEELASLSNGSGYNCGSSGSEHELNNRLQE